MAENMIAGVCLSKPEHHGQREDKVHVYMSDPLDDPRWARFIHRSQWASIFHTREWLDSLRRTYGYQPVIFTTSPPNQELENGVVFCRIRSWITGHRIVSVPFADHCEPLGGSQDQLCFLLKNLTANLAHEGWRYIEIRPVSEGVARMKEETGFSPAKTYYFHKVDLRPSLQEVFERLDKDSVQRRIRRAERAGLTYISGRSEALLKHFFRLLIRTRRRHRVPPQPYAWFRNLVDCMGEAASVRLAYKDSFPIAAVMTLRFRNTVYYKYGASDAAYHNLAAMPALLWSTIQESKRTGSEELDLGRSDCQDDGLRAFKDHWTHQRSRLVYWRHPARKHTHEEERRELKMLTHAFAFMPDRLLIVAGRLMYRHIG